MSNRYFIGGNWKLNGTRESIEELVKTYNDGGEFPASAEVVIAPTALHIGYVMENMRKDVSVAAQNISTDKGFGAYTGELTAELFKAWNVGWTLTGHSERRRRQQTRQLGHDEGSKSVANKTAHALSVGLKVILCIGETLQDREAGQTLEVCYEQLRAVQDVISKEDWANIVVAYEPVWAIGTGVTATPEQAQEVHQAVRKWLMTNLSAEIAEATRIIYGGSVKSKNAAGLIACEDIDGFLVGGASITADFIDIIKAVPKVWDDAKRSATSKRSAEEVQSIGADGKRLKT
jgi:triosephosphate isomerase